MDKLTNIHQLLLSQPGLPGPLPGVHLENVNETVDWDERGLIVGVRVRENKDRSRVWDLEIK